VPGLDECVHLVGDTADELPVVSPLRCRVARTERAIAVLVDRVTREVERVGIQPGIRVVTVAVADEESISVRVDLVDPYEAIAIIVPAVADLRRARECAGIEVVAVSVASGWTGLEAR
jgi:hypothetical protein